jgi:predicted nucleic acid-binding Zn ribbon protein
MSNCSVCGRVSRSNQFRCQHCGTPLRPGLFAAAEKGQPPEARIRPQPASPGPARHNRRQSQSEESADLIGQRYRIIKPLGGGAMKQVYLAEDLRLSNRPCALAEMIEDAWDSEDQHTFAEAFAREASILALLKHPRIPHVYDHFSENNRHFLVMEYVEGETLANRLKASPKGFLDQNFVISVALQVLEALQYLHSRTPAVIFRDLKPSNLIISNDGSVKMIDFGIARPFLSQKTATMVGTHGYAPPEQYEGKTEPRTDLYALGATMLNLLTGWDPAAHAPFSFPPLRQLRASCSPALEEIISQALMIDPNQRIASAEEFTRRLQTIRAADTSQSALRVGVQNHSLATVPTASAPATLLMSADAPTAVLTRHRTCRLCSRPIPGDAEACPYCLTAFEHEARAERSRVWLVAGLVFSSLLSMAFGVVLFVQHEDGRAAPAAKAVARPRSTASLAPPTVIPETAVFAHRIVAGDIDKPLSLREKMLCDRVGRGARLLTIAVGKRGDARNIKNLGHKLLALLDDTSIEEQNLLKDAFKIVIDGVQQNPNWTPEEQADMWRGTCRAERWPITNAQKKLLAARSLTEAASPASATSAARTIQTSAAGETSEEAEPAEALKYFCANAMLDQISHAASAGLNELSHESDGELARYGAYEGAAQACAAQGWLAANP